MPVPIRQTAQSNQTIAIAIATKDSVAAAQTTSCYALRGLRGRCNGAVVAFATTSNVEPSCARTAAPMLRPKVVADQDRDDAEADPQVLPNNSARPATQRDGKRQLREIIRHQGDIMAVSSATSEPRGSHRNPDGRVSPSQAHRSHRHRPSRPLPASARKRYRRCHLVPASVAPRLRGGRRRTTPPPQRVMVAR